MSIKAILFDLDGTLLPMKQDEFTKIYFGSLAKKVAPYGYEPNKLIESVWDGTKAMIKNTGEQTNKVVFWNKFAEIYGEKAKSDIKYFDEFYEQDFCKAQIACGKNSKAADVISHAKERGFKLALATNPIFPAIATHQRIKWAGLSQEDFEIITTYENSRCCKPNLKYYKDIISKLGVEPNECLMVGNDVSEDMVAKNLGMHVFLLTDCLINKNDEDISAYPNGNFEDLLNFILNLNKV